LLVPPRDPTALAEAMKTLIVDPARLARLARGATMRATEYDSVHWTGALVDICRELAR
jgi:hypothetical protein